MMKLLISIAAMVLLACQAEKCDEVSVLAFTHVQSNQLTLYKAVNGDVLKEIEPDEEAGWISQITKSQGNYYQISIQDLNLEGWVKKGSLGLNTRNYDGQEIELYESADKTSKSVGSLVGEQTVKILDACGKWAYVEGVGKDGKIQGWLEPDMQCGNPYTTCP